MGVLEVKPRKVSAGDIKLGTPAPLQINVENTGDADMAITKIVSKKHGTVYFDAVAKSKIILRPGEVRAIPIEIIVEKQGRYLDYVMVHSDARNVTTKGYKVVVVASGI
jgi:predicted component of type VI protein secretion system